MARVDVATGLKPAYSFAQLVIGPNNHVAAAACQEVIKAPGEMYNPLVIYGPAGVGKTHLMQAVAHQVLSQNPDFKVKYISSERFTNDVVTAIAEDRMVDIRKSYSALDLLIMDDIQYLVESKIAQEELFHIFNNMHQENRQVILASDRPPNQLTSLSKGIRSRLEWGLATDIQAPNETTRVEILRMKQQAQGLAMSDEMLLAVAHALRSNVRELEGFLKRVHAYVTLSHQELSIQLVNAIVKELAPDLTEPSTVASLNDESPGLPPTPGIAPELTRVLNADQGHKNGTNGANGTNGSHSKNGTHRKGDVPPDVSNQTPPAADLPASAPAEPVPTPSPVPVTEPAVEFFVSPEPAAAPDPVRAAQPMFADAVIPPIPPAPSAPPEAAPAPVAPPAPVPEPASPEPVAIQVLPDTPEENGEQDSELPAGHKAVAAVFFFPEGKTEALETIDRKFQDVIRKHKLKYRLKRLHDEPYAYKGKVDYARFADVCKDKKAPVAIIIGPPPESLIPEQDFYDRITAALNVDGVSAQLVNWGEINKDYRYLNLALDIALVKAAR